MTGWNHRWLMTIVQPRRWGVCCSLVFNEETMKERLSSASYGAWYLYYGDTGGYFCAVFYYYVTVHREVVGGYYLSVGIDISSSTKKALWLMKCVCIHATT